MNNCEPQSNPPPVIKLNYSATLPCGHPSACAREDVDGTYCGWCAEVNALIQAQLQSECTIQVSLSDVQAYSELLRHAVEQSKCSTFVALPQGVTHQPVEALAPCDQDGCDLPNIVGKS